MKKCLKNLIFNSQSWYSNYLKHVSPTLQSISTIISFHILRVILPAVLFFALAANSNYLVIISNGVCILLWS